MANAKWQPPGTFLTDEYVAQLTGLFEQLAADLRAGTASAPFWELAATTLREGSSRDPLASLVRSACLDGSALQCAVLALAAHVGVAGTVAPPVFATFFALWQHSAAARAAVGRDGPLRRRHILQIAAGSPGATLESPVELTTPALRHLTGIQEVCPELVGCASLRAGAVSLLDIIVDRGVLGRLSALFEQFEAVRRLRRSADVGRLGPARAAVSALESGLVVAITGPSGCGKSPENSRDVRPWRNSRPQLCCPRASLSDNTATLAFPRVLYAGQSEFEFTPSGASGDLGARSSHSPAVAVEFA